MRSTRFLCRLKERCHFRNGCGDRTLKSRYLLGDIPNWENT